MGTPSTISVKYEEGPLSVDIPEAGVVAERGKPVTVDTEIGERLIEQGWVKARTPKKTSPSSDKSESGETKPAATIETPETPEAAA